MASTPEFVRYVCEQIAGAGAVRYRKMFGEYLIYVDERPAVLVIENTAYVKCLPVLEDLALETGHPFPDGPAYYVLDIDKAEQCRDAAARGAAGAPRPAQRRRKRREGTPWVGVPFPACRPQESVRLYPAGIPHSPAPSRIRR